MEAAVLLDSSRDGALKTATKRREGARLVVAAVPVSLDWWEERRLVVRDGAGNRLPVDEERLAPGTHGVDAILAALETHGHDVSVAVPVLNRRVLGNVDRPHACVS